MIIAPPAEDFQTGPGAFHIVALARSEAAARTAYPIALLDSDDPKAIGSGKPKIQFGPAARSITNGTAHGGGTLGDPNAFPPTNCGLVQFGQAPCTFRGGDDVESQGGVAGFGATGPAPIDWKITINANPGTYDMFCYIHPGMRGKVKVVGNGQGEDQSENDDNGRVTTQAQIDAASGMQFRADREDALEVERAASVVRFTGEEPGERTYIQNVGLSAADDHVAIDEMLPQKLDLKQGDRVHFVWADPHNSHTATFPTGSANLPPPAGPDMEAPDEAFEIVGDPALHHQARCSKIRPRWSTPDCCGNADLVSTRLHRTGRSEPMHRRPRARTHSSAPFTTTLRAAHRGSLRRGNSTHA